MAVGYRQSNREGAKYMGPTDKCGSKNHKLKTCEFWKIIFKADEQELDRTTALLLKVWTLE